MIWGTCPLVMRAESLSEKTKYAARSTPDDALKIHQSSCCHTDDEYGGGRWGGEERGKWKVEWLVEDTWARQDRRSDTRGADEPNEARTAKSWEQVDAPEGDLVPLWDVCGAVRHARTPSRPSDTRGKAGLLWASEARRGERGASCATPRPDETPEQRRTAASYHVQSAEGAKKQKHFVVLSIYIKFHFCSLFLFLSLPDFFIALLLTLRSPLLSSSVNGKRIYPNIK